MNAESLDNSEQGEVDTAARKVYRMLADGIENIGGIVPAAGLCGVDRSDLRKALDRNGRRVAVEHAIAIGARLRTYNASLTAKLGSALVETFDLEVFPRVTLTDREARIGWSRWFVACRLASSCLPMLWEVVDEDTRVYFIETVDSSAIKIGLSSDVQRRLSVLQTASPVRLLLLASVPGVRADEARLHRRFFRERLSGEWFKGDGQLRDLVASILTMSTEEARAEILREVVVEENEEELAAERFRYEAVEDACFALIRELGIERSAEELTKRWGPVGRPVSIRLLTGVLEGTNYFVSNGFTGAFGAPSTFKRRWLNGGIRLIACTCPRARSRPKTRREPNTTASPLRLPMKLVTKQQSD